MQLLRLLLNLSMQHNEVLTNVRAPKVARARRLLKRGFRESDGAFLAEGPQACREAALAEKVIELFLTQEALERYPEIVATVESSGAEITLCTATVIEQFSSTVTPQGMTAVVRMWDQNPAEIFKADTKLVVALTAVRDPGNAGAVIRVADAAGANGVIMSSDSVDLFNPKVVRASVGSLFHLPIAIGQDLAETVIAARDAGMQVLAADTGGVSLYDGIDLAKPTLWIFGNEAWGIPKEVLELADQVVSIPIYGAAESLNLATASALCLYASATAQNS
jgi:RNA methyltransferase, TrmH family